MEEELLTVDINVDGFRIAFGTRDPAAVKAYGQQVLAVFTDHVKSITQARAFAEIKMISLLNDTRKPEEPPVTT